MIEPVATLFITGIFGLLEEALRGQGRARVDVADDDGGDLLLVHQLLGDLHVLGFVVALDGDELAAEHTPTC